MKRLQPCPMALILTLVLLPVSDAKSTPITFQPANASQTNIETLIPLPWAELKMRIYLAILQANQAATTPSDTSQTNTTSDTSQTNTATFTETTWADRKMEIARITQSNFSNQSSPTADRTQINTVNITRTLLIHDAGTSLGQIESFGMDNGVDNNVARLIGTPLIGTPEPSSLFLLASGLAGLYAFLNKSRKKGR